MIADLLAAILLLAMAGLGWYRGALVQVVTVLAAGILWLSFDLWFPPTDLALARLGGPLADMPYLRKLVGFLAAYLAVVALLAIIELVARRSGKVDVAGRRIGVGLGALLGFAYVVLLAWFVETVTLWDKDPYTLTPSWMRESRVMRAVAPWNPVRVYTLKEALERGITRVDRERAARAQARKADGGEALDPAAAAATPDDDARGMEPQDPIDVVALETDARARVLFKASPVRQLMEETASLSEWQGRGYGDLVRDPRVRAILKDADLADLLLGE